MFKVKYCIMVLVGGARSGDVLFMMKIKSIYFQNKFTLEVLIIFFFQCTSVKHTEEVHNAI